MNSEKGVVFVFAILSDNFIVYGKSDDENFEKLSDDFKQYLNNPKIEIVRPSNMHVGQYESGILHSHEDFEKFKEELTNPTIESTIAPELPTMPKWVELAKSCGRNVIFDDGKWKVRIS